MASSQTHTDCDAQESIIQSDAEGRPLGKEGNMEESTKKREPDRTYAGMTRRTLCIGAGGAALALGLGTLKLVDSAAAIRPPGAQNEDRLLANCIRCEKCVEACPRHIIVPTHLEDGIVGMRTPTLDFSANWCDWCTEENNGIPLCSQVCPTQAIDKTLGSTPDNTVIGVAEINTDWCLAWRFKGCRFCLDACEHDAIELDENDMPHIHGDRCNGCGACYTACVSLKEGSILADMTDRAIVIKPISELDPDNLAALNTPVADSTSR